MYRRLITAASIIFTALTALCFLGLHSINLQVEGLTGKRIAAFSEVAEQIRIDVKHKLDQFILTEQKRPYTDYQYFYTPVTFNNDDNAILRSPLAGTLTHGLAYGHFQIEPDGTITSPFYNHAEDKLVENEVRKYIVNIQDNLLSVLKHEIKQTDNFALKKQTSVSNNHDITNKNQQLSAANYQVQSLQDNIANSAQIINQTRKNIIVNRRNNRPAASEVKPEDPGRPGLLLQPDPENTEIVQVRIEPFVPLVVPDPMKEQTYFTGQVFILRHVQIEKSHFLQGFKLNEKELISQITESVDRLLRTGMDYHLGNRQSKQAAHTATLDFGFGNVTLNLLEKETDWIEVQASNLRNWYLAIVTIVFIATVIAILSLWQNLETQIKLARKKDDFISAVSHELRTPLTTIRMYTEMLENNWVKTDQKRTEYYGTMRQESERLTRMIENVLNFSRIQRGCKKYCFATGNINKYIEEVTLMMTPLAAKQNFSIGLDLKPDLPATSFDSDAIMQITINLIDNALKYAHPAKDKTIKITTRTEGRYILIEVQDQGPGIPNSQRKKIFDEFYRIGEESKRETTGTGLGLALVKKFTTAHSGFVRVLSAKPKGALLRIAIPITTRKNNKIHPYPKMP